MHVSLKVVLHKEHFCRQTICNRIKHWKWLEQNRTGGGYDLFQGSIGVDVSLVEHARVAPLLLSLIHTAARTEELLLEARVEPRM